MFMLKVENVKMELDGVAVFEHASLEIQENERVALIGENGVGKTTLLKGILGQLPITEGKITFGIPHDEIGWMMQDSDDDACLSTREWVESENQELIQLRKDLLKSQKEQRLDDYSEILQRYLDMDGYQWEVQVEKMLNQLGLSQVVWELPFSSLSGGQKTRAKLARVMMKSPKLLVLDEPTNHLDTETIQWLQDWLNRYRGSVLFISHERDFIDQTAQMTYELMKKGTKKYQGGYQAYKVQKDHEIKSLQSLYEKQQQERRKLMETIQMYKNWYQQANAAASVRNPFAQKQAAKQAAKYKTKEKELERLESQLVDKPQEVTSIQASFDARDFSGKRMLDINQVSFSYGNDLVLHKVNMQIKQGDRLAVIGKNGSGKTTLLKLMAGKLTPTSGEIVRNPQLKIGYFFQELENLHPEHTILEEILSLPNMTQSEARTILACFLFRKEEVYKQVKELSMGEKCRVAFVKLYFSGANLLILDEPTNYLDIVTRERIEEMLGDYEGAVVVVAHDPYLLRKIANTVAIIEEGKVSHYIGTYEEWEQHVRISPQIQQLKNEQQRLEWKIATLLGEDGVETEEQQLEKVRKLKQQLEQLKRMED
ncbi:ribosomal protection-like ABC-F family protein [Bacillus sp. FJAT-42315]|uniref:ribosomal protection-like ABC-F family protein n=1 Tax=Bacillus sp. FJAT-42315 TaxID=2014077 RepID=UPI000C23315F|nr:ABC-F type ribosomal protection protein [Bacillus sp. FJAT-42315]